MTFFYRQEGDEYWPDALATSPWDPAQQNGIAISGLLAHLVETIPAPQPMLVGRLVIDILSAVTFGPARARCQVLRDGKRIQMVTAELLQAERVVARATALRVRLAASPAVARSNPYLAPEACPALRIEVGHSFGAILSDWFAGNGLRAAGPCQVWARIDHQHVSGVAITPLVRAAVLSDIGMGVDRILSPAEWSFANLDIAMHFTRMPRGEWLLIDAATHSAGNGIGLVHSLLADRAGVFASLHQTLFIAPRP